MDEEAAKPRDSTVTQQCQYYYGTFQGVANYHPPAPPPQLLPLPQQPQHPIATSPLFPPGHGYQNLQGPVGGFVNYAQGYPVVPGLEKSRDCDWGKATPPPRRRRLGTTGCPYTRRRRRYSEDLPAAKEAVAQRKQLAIGLLAFFNSDSPNTAPPPPLEKTLVDPAEKIVELSTHTEDHEDPPPQAQMNAAVSDPPTKTLPSYPAKADPISGPCPRRIRFRIQTRRRPQALDFHRVIAEPHHGPGALVGRYTAGQPRRGPQRKRFRNREHLPKS